MSLETDMEKVIRAHGYRISAYTRDEIQNLVDGLVNENADEDDEPVYADEDPWAGREDEDDEPPF
jgi:hypothetical protein